MWVCSDRRERPIHSRGHGKLRGEWVPRLCMAWAVSPHPALQGSHAPCLGPAGPAAFTRGRLSIPCVVLHSSPRACPPLPSTPRRGRGEAGGLYAPPLCTHSLSPKTLLQTAGAPGGGPGGTRELWESKGSESTLRGSGSGTHSCDSLGKSLRFLVCKMGADTFTGLLRGSKKMLTMPGAE